MIDSKSKYSLIFSPLKMIKLNAKAMTSDLQWQKSQLAWTTDTDSCAEVKVKRCKETVRGKKAPDTRLSEDKCSENLDFIMITCSRWDLLRSTVNLEGLIITLEQRRSHFSSNHQEFNIICSHSNTDNNFRTSKAFCITAVPDLGSVDSRKCAYKHVDQDTDVAGGLREWETYFGWIPHKRRQWLQMSFLGGSEFWTQVLRSRLPEETT